MNVSEGYHPMPSEFVLGGLSWLEEQKIPFSLFFLVIYLGVILGNCLIIVLVKADPKLHEPMHIFISLLALVDLALSSVVIPKVLVILWFESNIISSGACLTQMYVLYVLLALESSLFALMSFDRYVAICHPLRHSSLMTNSFMAKLVLFVVLRNLILLVPLPVLTEDLTFCKGNFILHSYCEFIELIKLSCSDFTQFMQYMVVIVCFIPGCDNILIIFSYIMILKVVHSLESSQARWKTLNTCSSHAIMLALFYISSCIPLILFVYVPNPPLYIKTCLEIFSCLLLPMTNPIVYGVRTKEIQKGFKRLNKKLLVK
ncbi:olfactory receptor 52N2-like [Pelodytes ibericus]